MGDGIDKGEGSVGLGPVDMCHKEEGGVRCAGNDEVGALRGGAVAVVGVVGEWDAAGVGETGGGAGAALGDVATRGLEVEDQRFAYELDFQVEPGLLVSG